MSDARPISFQWMGDGFRPSGPFWERAADKAFVIGEHYTLVEHHDRTANTHRHYFAAINETWKNLPEHLAEQFPTAEHLRKYALIKAGFADSHTLTCSSRAEALRIAAFIRPTDEFSIVTTSEATVTRYTAQSQSMRAMGKMEFQRSKEAVLGVLAEMIGVQPKDLKQHAKAA